MLRWLTSAPLVIESTQELAVFAIIGGQQHACALAYVAVWHILLALLNSWLCYLHVINDKAIFCLSARQHLPEHAVTCQPLFISLCRFIRLPLVQPLFRWRMLVYGFLHQTGFME